MQKNPLLVPTWKDRTEKTHNIHLEKLKNLQERGGEVDVLLLGSSMIERFETSGVNELSQWNFKYFLAGVGGDGVQHMLYRLANNLIESTPATLNTVILMAGTNNIEKFSEQQIVEGVINLITVIHSKRSALKIKLFGLPPRESTVKKIDNRQMLEKVIRLNGLLQDYVVKTNDDRIKYYSFYNKLVYRTGNRMDAFFDDHVHLNAKGYNIFSQAIMEAMNE